MYRFQLTNIRRSTCPHCGKENKYSAYIDTETNQLTAIEYGMCSSCGEYTLPPFTGETQTGISIKEDIAFYEADTIPTISYDVNYYQHSSYISNNFIEILERKFGENQVKRSIDLYKIGRDYCNGESTNGVVFPYFFSDDHLCTAKIMWYDNDLHRIKEGKFSYPKWLHTMPAYLNYDTDDEMNEIVIPFKFKLCFFGHNQIINDKQKTICLVESEKTAFIMSIVMPEYTWLASGGKTMIQDYKFLFFSRRNVLVFPDLSEENKTSNYWLQKLNYLSINYRFDLKMIDYAQMFPADMQNVFKCNGCDVADFVLNFNTNNWYLIVLKRSCLKSL